MLDPGEYLIVGTRAGFHDVSKDLSSQLTKKIIGCILFVSRNNGYKKDRYA